MPPVSPVRSAVVWVEVRAVQVAPLWPPLYHHAPVWLLIVSLALVCVTALGVSVGVAGDWAVAAGVDAAPSTVPFLARTRKQ